jgi:uncharacterized phosphosugar-binding protein
MKAMVSGEPAAGRLMTEHLAAIEEANGRELGLIAERMLAVVSGGGLILTAGTGHSLAMVMESFFRAGGLACVRPIYHPALLPLEGARFSTTAEKTHGLAATLIEQAAPRRGDLAFVFSNSGVNAVPVELAQGLKEAGAEVVGVLSRLHMEATGKHPNLGEIADHVLDTRVPYGDAFHETAGGAKIAPLSTLSTAFLWNLLLVRLADLGRERAVRVPVWTSGNVAGGADRNAELLAGYAGRVPTL